MFYDSELRFLENILQKCHLQTAKLNPDLPLTNEFPFIVQYAQTGKSFYDLFPETKPRTVYHITDARFCRYIVLQLPFCDTETLLLAGPYLPHDITHADILEWCEKQKLEPQEAKAVETLFSTLPVVQDEHHILAVISSFADFLWNADGGYDYTKILADDPQPITQAPILSEKENTALQQIEALELRYGYENELLHAVAQGNLQKAEMMMSGFSSLAFEERVPDRLRNLKNYSIVTNTLFRKAVQDSGVHPLYIDRLSSRMARKIESIRSSAEIPQCLTDLARSYCRLVKEHTGKQYSPVIQKAVAKIENDLTGDLSLRTIAKTLNVSAGYLSGLFKKETGDTLTAFVTAKRIAHAKHLLRHTALQIQTVAQHCGILDLHYFCRIFKEHTGKTPSAYRSQYR